MPNQDFNIIAEISILYEISLAVGQSLDLKTNCEQFLRTLLARKNLSFGALWLKSGLLAVPSADDAESHDLDGFSLVYATPESRVSEKTIPTNHPLVEKIARDGAFSIASNSPEFGRFVTEKNAHAEVCAVFMLGGIGFLKLLSAVRRTPFEEQELNMLRSVLAKFTVSIEGCLAHQELVWEIVERRQAEEALRHSEEKYRNVVERAMDGILVIQDGLVVYANGRLCHMAGMSREEIAGLSFMRFLHPSDAARIVDRYKRRMAGEAVPQVYEASLIDAHGSPVEVELNAGVITYEGKSADLVFVHDIRDRKKFEAERARLALAVEQTADGVMITDTGGAIQYVNPAFERITGYRRSEVLGENPRILKSEAQDAKTYAAMWDALQSGGLWRGRLQNRRKDGSIVTCDTIITPTRDESGAIVSYVSVQRDVTRELQMEEQYLQAQKMESIGRLAGGIAHDFNNIMTAILGFGTMILDQVGDNNFLRHAVEQIVSAGERATNLTRQLLTFSRKQMVEVRILDINSVIAEMYQLLRRALGEDVELLTQLEDEAGSVRTDTGLLQQVVMNLAINARDAMPRGGKLTIRTRAVTLDDAFCKDRVSVTPGPYILLSVADTGSGMCREVLTHVFEPFFTTKPKGKGTGLGLATVYGIVQQCRGHIEIKSAEGKGTEILIWLPRVQASDETIPVEVEDRIQRGSETILVVEDEELVRDLTVRILKSLGYKVIEAVNGKDGLSEFRSHRKEIDMVLTDVVMPQMGGPEMAENLLDIRPELKVLYTSGFSEIAVVEKNIPVGGDRLIQKPYTREILAQRIRQTLDDQLPE